MEVVHNELAPLSKPSRLQFAIAYACVRSKPADVTMREHLKRLQKLVLLRAAGPVDWKYLYEQSEAENADLQRVVSDLQSASAALHAKVNPPESDGGLVERSTKRKKTEVEAGKGAKSVKKSKINSGSTLQEETSIREDFGIFESCGRDGTAALTHLQTVHEICRDPVGRPADLTGAVTHTALATATLLKTALLKVQDVSIGSTTVGAYPRQRNALATKDQTKLDEEFSSLIRAVARIHSSLLYGLDKVSCAETDSSQHKGPIIYAVVKLFGTGLQGIKDYIAAEMRSTDAESQDGGPVRKTQKSIKKQDIPKILSQLLTAMLSVLDPESSAQRELFEGFMFVLLQRMGSLLYIWVFDQKRTATVSTDISTTFTGDSGKDDHDTELGDRIRKREALYLMPVLERALNIAPKHLDVQPATSKRSKTGGTSSRNGSPAKTGLANLKGLLSLDAKERLQKTLIKGIFGEDDDMVLRMPASVPIPPPPKINDSDVVTWYTNELWRLMGWDILGRKSE